MRVFHPSQPVNGVAPENVFMVADSANITVADGFLIQTYHPYLFPERPINMFLSVRSGGPGRDMLIGALLARALQLHQQTPYLKARAFAQVGIQDMAMMNFLLDSGFVADSRMGVHSDRRPFAVMSRASSPCCRKKYTPSPEQSNARSALP